MNSLGLVRAWWRMRSRWQQIVICSVGIVFLLLGFAVWQYHQPRYISEQQVWRMVRKEATRADLDPAFVYAIVHAESSRNAHARTHVARGIMQLTRPAWKTVSDLPYVWAWDWRHNITMGVQYLTWCRVQLEREGRFSYPLLAASYRYGFNHVREQGYDIGRVRAPDNPIYEALFAGERSPVPLP